MSNCTLDICVILKKDHLSISYGKKWHKVLKLINIVKDSTLMFIHQFKLVLNKSNKYKSGYIISNQNNNFIDLFVIGDLTFQ